MPGLTPDALTDFVKISLPHYEKKKATNLSYELTDYVGTRMLFNKEQQRENHKRIIDSGHTFEFKIRTGTSGNARMSGMFATEQLNRRNTIQTATCPWRKAITGWEFDVDEPEFQSDEATKILDQIDILEEDAMLDYWEMIENQVWQSPASPTADEMLGIPFWLTPALAGEEGFVGLAPSGHTTVAGLSPSTYTKWRNWAFDYTDVSKLDLITKLRRACYETTFKAPDPVAKSELDGGDGSSTSGHYTTYSVTGPMELILESQNDNLGPDVAKYAGKVMFKGNPVIPVPKLDQLDTGSECPWYGINWKTMKGIIKKNRNGQASPVLTPHDQPSTRQVFRTWWQNILCINRRRNFRGGKIA
jgi:hypothetical protein